MAQSIAKQKSDEIMKRLRSKHGVNRTGIAAAPAPKKERVGARGKKQEKVRTVPVAKTKTVKAFPICGCGCGESTRGGKWKPGHDSKFYSAQRGPKVYPDCKCGCGEKTLGGVFKPGHDSKWLSQQKKPQAEAADKKHTPKTRTAGSVAA